METKKQNQGWFILGGIALLLLGFFIYQNYTNKQHDWKMDFEEESKEPYGTFVIREVLEQAVAQDSFIVLDEKIEGFKYPNISSYGSSTYVKLVTTFPAGA